MRTRFMVVLLLIASLIGTVSGAAWAVDGKPALAEAERAYVARNFGAVEGLLKPALADPSTEAEALLLLGRSYVYLGRFEDARGSIASARTKGLPPDRQRDADYAMQYIVESLAEAVEIPRNVVYETTGYVRTEFVSGLARDATVDPQLVPQRKSDTRLRAGAAFGAEFPVATSATSMALGLGADELRYRNYGDFDEANLRGSARLQQRFSDLVASS